MNKITSTLAGLAVVATASIAPAFAQGGLFTPPGGFTFSFLGGGSVFTASSTSVGFNPSGGGPTTTASFSLVGTQISGSLYSVNTLLITPLGGPAFLETNPLSFLVTALPTGPEAINSIGAASDGTSINLVSAPVPEASTVVSFGALLALGGMAVVLRRKNVKNAA